jgi:hypothetical protein
MCSLHVILLSKITPRYFTLFTNGMFPPFNVRGSDCLRLNSDNKSASLYILLECPSKISSCGPHRQAFHWYSLFYSWSGLRLSPWYSRPLVGPLYQPRMIDEINVNILWKKSWLGEPNFSEKICSNATLSSTNFTINWPGIEPRPAR